MLVGFVRTNHQHDDQEPVRPVQYSKPGLKAAGSQDCATSLSQFEDAVTRPFVQERKVKNVFVTVYGYFSRE